MQVEPNRERLAAGYRFPIIRGRKTLCFDPTVEVDGKKGLVNQAS